MTLRVSLDDAAPRLLDLVLGVPEILADLDHILGIRRLWLRSCRDLEQPLIDVAAILTIILVEHHITEHIGDGTLGLAAHDDCPLLQGRACFDRLGLDLVRQTRQVVAAQGVFDLGHHSRAVGVVAGETEE